MQIMWMQDPGNNKRAAYLAGALALIWLILGGQPAGAKEPVKKGKEEKAAAPTEIAPKASEVAFIGKFTCPLKRMVVLPFQGIIISLKVHAGQRVKAGEVLARYSLTPEASMQLRRRLFPPHIKDLQVRLAEMERALSLAAAKRREVEELAAKNMASRQALAQAKKNWRLLAEQKQATQSQLRQEQNIISEQIQALREQMGNSLRAGHVPKEGALKSPIDGYVLFVHPNLRKSAELPGKTIAFQVGVMDPMVVKAQVHEMESLKVAVGDQAEILPESLPGRKFEARVSRLSWVPMKPGLEQPTYYEAEFQVPNPDLILKEGMKVRIVLRKPR